MWWVQFTNNDIGLKYNIGQEILWEGYKGIILSYWKTKTEKGYFIQIENSSLRTKFYEEEIEIIRNSIRKL